MLESTMLSICWSIIIVVVVVVIVVSFCLFQVSAVAQPLHNWFTHLHYSLDLLLFSLWRFS